MREKEFSIKTLCRTFWNLEKEEKLFDLEIQNAKVWELIRFNVFFEITRELNLYELAHSQKNTMKEKLSFLPKLIFNTFLRNPLRGNYTRNILIFDHPRKMKTQGTYIDIYTNYFIETLKKNEYDVIESPYLWKHLTKRSDKNRKYTDALILKKFIRKYKTNYQLDEYEIEMLIQLESKLFETFNVKVELVNRVQKVIKLFNIEFEYYKKLFQKRSPQKIYVVISYGKGSLIAAAKSCNVEVIEFQHGVITPYHIAYSFPHLSQKLEYFPEKILTFGKYWGEATQFPKDVKYEVYGFPYLKEKFKKNKEVKKNRKQILILSQGTIGNKLSEFTYKLAQKLPDYKIIYKLHPGEYNRWKSSYPFLIKASEFENVTIIENNNTDLHSYLSESEYQIGVYSTAIFEGLTFGCKTILFNIEGIEYMEYLVTNKIVIAINNEDECVKAVKNFKAKPFDSDYFFE